MTAITLNYSASVKNRVLSTIGSRGYFFLSILMVLHGEAGAKRREKKHSLFQNRYFENGPLEPG